VSGRDLPERLKRDIEPGKHAVGLRQKHAFGAQGGNHNRVCGDISVADVLVKRAPDDVAIEGRVEPGHHGAGS